MFFEYDKSAISAEYYDVLQSLMERWEYEIVEFKEAKSSFNEDKLGQYFSALSNEANLKQQQYGWIVFGVSEKEEKHIVGTTYKNNVDGLEKLKYEISKNTSDGITFLDIIELHPVVSGIEYRVLMFKVPAATTGIPTAWKNRYWARSGESLVPLSQYKIDLIRGQERRDWSKQLTQATIECLDAEAIDIAKEKYKEKMNRKHISEEVDAMSTEAFLTKMKLMVDGRVTNAGMVLLGNQDYDYLLNTPPMVMWRLYGANGEDKDYEIFRIPFIKVADQVFAKIRNLTYRYLPNQLSLFPKQTEQYDQWLLRELLNNCMAHANYQLGGRIYINEFEDKISFTNPGDFLPQNIEAVLQTSYNPPFYRNQLLAESMANFHMIDTAAMGIRKVFRIQKEKYFPMPDYDFSNNQVGVTVYGKILDDKYTQLLFRQPDLDLETVYLLDRVQKKLKLSKEAVACLRKHKLVEGRAPNLFISEFVAQDVKEEAQYIKNKAFDDKYYKDLIIRYIATYGKANRSDIRTLLWDKLSDVLTDEQKESKIKNLLQSMRRNNVIVPNVGNSKKAYWILSVK